MLHCIFSVLNYFIGMNETPCVDQTSFCKSLFGQESHEVFSRFKNLKKEEAEKEAKLIDQYLELAVRVNVHLLSKKDCLPILDPSAMNNQCHLYTLKAAQLMRDYPKKTEEEKMAKNDDNLFLNLTFFLSKPFINDKAVFIEIVKQALKEMGKEENEIPGGREKFFTFLMDKKNEREKAARYALNQLFEKSIKEMLASHQKEDVTGLYTDLRNLSNEKLHLSYKGISKTLYTYPKLAGVAYMIDILAKEKIPFVIKSMVITKEGVGGVIMVANGKIENQDIPVIVFEGITITDGSLSIPEFVKKTLTCPNNYYRDEKKKHKEQDKCVLCTTTTVDLKPYQERLEKIMKDPQEMLYALGTDFILKAQKSFKTFFEDKKYPVLTKIFENSVSKIEQLGLDMNDPKTFSVDHVYLDTSSHAFSTEMLMNRSCETLFVDRELLCKK